MTALRDNLSWLVIMVVAGLVALLSWFYSSELFATVAGVLIGAGVTYVVQTRTQKNSWKREYSVKIAEDVYGALYSEVSGIVADLETGRFFQLIFGKWGEFRKDHRHLMVTKEFREQLDKLSEGVKEYDDDDLRLIQEVLPGIVNEASKTVFGLIANTINIEVKYKHANGNYGQENYNPLECLTRRKHPREIVLESYPRSEILGIQVSFGYAQEVFRPLPSPPTVDEAKFNEFWNLCREQEERNELYKTVIQKQSLLLKESKLILEELTKRIEEPW